MQFNMPLWWSIVCLSALAFGLAACDSPSPRFQGVAARQVTVDGSRFSVRATRSEAEAIRVNGEWRARRGAVVAKAAVAIEQASGCAVRKGSLHGDTNIVKARLNCPDRDRATPPNSSLNCGFVTPFRKDVFGKSADFECDVLQGR